MAELKDIEGLSRKTFQTRVGLTALRVVTAFWSLILLIAVFLAMALFGVIDVMAPTVGALSTLVFFVGLIILGSRGRRRFIKTSEGDAHAALDALSEDRPIAGLSDRPSTSAPAARLLWRAHTKRLRRAAIGLNVPRFVAEWRALDPFYLRFAVPALLAIGFVSSWGDVSGRIGRALMPDYGSLIGAEDVRVEAWISPPEYSRRPPVFLSGDGTPVLVPAGSEVTVRAQARSAPKLVLRGTTQTQRQRFEETPDGAYETRAVVTEDALLAVNWWGRRAAWQITTSPDSPPMPRFDEPPVLGENDRTEFSWSVVDDYGVERLELALKLVEPHPAVPEDERRVRIELPGASVREATEDSAIDMTRHPWAGLLVSGRLVATDGAGQEGESEPHEFKFPEKLFLQNLARATQEIRVTALREPRAYEEGYVGPINALESAPEGVQQAALMLEAVTFSGEKYFDDYGIFSGLAAAHGTLKSATNLDEARALDGLLWAVALKAEYGSSADALAALLAARRALEEALREGATEEELLRLTDAFRQAAENYVQAKLAEAIANGLPEGATQDGLDNQQAGGAGGPSLGQNSFEEMLQALEDLSQTGARDQARQLLSDITNMLENLEFQQGNGQGGDGFALPNQGGEGEEGEESSEQQELAENLEDLAEALREQRELNDDTLEAGRQAEDSRRQQGGGQAGQVPELSGEELAERQEAIGDLLEALRERSEQGGAGDDEGEDGLPGGEATEQALEDALRAQRRAEDSLREGQFGRAQRDQERATNRLRDVAGELASALDELRSENQQQSQTDPFGRETSGANSSEGIDVPDQSERQRALDILEELRRRYSDPSDEDERDYLERLLDRF
ncbi:MAG: DUF4175 family protein [Pseudomonadota bacterium]